MPRLIRSTSVAIGFYCFAWLIAFLSVVGFEPSLVPSYFMLGWSLSGLEIATFVWLLAWPIFISLLLVRYLIKRRLEASQESAT